MVWNPRNMQVVGQKELCTLKHTCDQQVEYNINPLENQKNTQND